MSSSPSSPWAHVEDMYGVYSQSERRVFDPRSSGTILMSRCVKVLVGFLVFVTFFFLVIYQSPTFQYRAPTTTFSPPASPPPRTDTHKKVTKAKSHSIKGHEGQHRNVATPAVQAVQAPTPTVEDEPDTPSPYETPDGTSESTQPSEPDGHNHDRPVDWSTVAYSQYVTGGQFLCRTVMFFEALHRLGSKADRVLAYPSHMLHDPSIPSHGKLSGEARMLLRARERYNVKLQPVNIAHRGPNNYSFTKLLAFNQTSYTRVLVIDPEVTILEPPDELFLLPPTPIAMPRAYWLLNTDEPTRMLTPDIMLIQPSTFEHDRVQRRVDTASSSEYDMDIVNDLYFDSALVLPHRRYLLLSSEFRGTNDQHALYLGSKDEVWDPIRAYDESKLIHFADEAVPRPWIAMSDKEREANQPPCIMRWSGQYDCTEQMIWNSLYENYTERKKEICTR